MSEHYEKRYRSILKALSWRVTGTVDTIIIVLFITGGDITKALSVGAIELFTKFVLYYFHERMWGKITLGRISKDIGYQI
jgi:uncharacterized membrane protein